MSALGAAPGAGTPCCFLFLQFKVNDLAHTKWLCSYKRVEILEGHFMAGHIHMLVSIPPKNSVSGFKG